MVRFLPLFVFFTGCGLLLDADPQVEGGRDGGVVDGMVDGGDCVPMVELCNGLDDDCNGLVDDDCRCDRYVLGGAMGDGTSGDTPMGSINRAIGELQARGGAVCVGARVESGTCRETRYGERVRMVEGVDVTGGFRGEGADWGVPATDCVTVIDPGGSTEGVLFSDGMTEATALSNFEVEGPDSFDMSTAAVRFVGGGTMRNVVAEGGAAPLSAGVWATASGGDLVRIEGGEVAGPELSTAGMNDTVDAYGIFVEGREVRVQDTRRIFGGDASADSAGILAIRGVDLRVVDVPIIEGGSAPTSAGVALIGCDRVELRDVETIRGGDTAVESRGLFIDRSTEVDVRSGDAILGGSAATESLGVGVFDSELDIASFREIAAGPAPRAGGAYVAGASTLSALSIGALYGAMGAVDSGDYFGLVCDAAGGVGPTCQIEQSAIFGVRGSTAPMARGVGVYGPTSALLSNDEIRSAEVHGSGFGVDVGEGATVVLDANRVYERALRDGMSHAAIRIFESQATLTNNLLTVTDAAGLVIDSSESGSPPVVEVNSNTFIALPSADAPAGTGVAPLVRLGEGTPSGEAPIFLRNNIFLCREDIDVPYVAELGLSAAVVEHDVFWGCLQGWLSPDADSLPDLFMYLQTRGSNNETTAAPLIDDDGHIMSGSSPAVDNGTTTMGPSSDIDGERRDADAAPDIGCDEWMP